MGPLRSRLREATAPAHTRLDAIWSTADLADPTTYRAFLRATAAALLPLERQLDRRLSPGESRVPGDPLADWPARRRTPALLSDLAGLGLTAPEPLTAPPLASSPETLGILYVLEGSRLGGKLLLRHANASPDPLVRAHTGFLAHGQGLLLWPTFLAQLEAADPADTELICARACSTFALFEAAAVRERSSPRCMT